VGGLVLPFVGHEMESMMMLMKMKIILINITVIVVVELIKGKR